MHSETGMNTAASPNNAVMLFSILYTTPPLYWGDPILLIPLILIPLILLLILLIILVMHGFTAAGQHDGR